MSESIYCRARPFFGRDFLLKNARKTNESPRICSDIKLNDKLNIDVSKKYIMLEIERYISNGKEGAFFRIRDNSSLGVKVLFADNQETAKNLLQVEFDKAKILKKIGVSVPDYKEVIQVKIPEHIDQTLSKTSKNMARGMGFYTYDAMKEFFINHKNELIWGLVMEYIPDDLVQIHLNVKHIFVSFKRIKHIFQIEKTKIELLGIVIGESLHTHAYGNILWSESRAKLYFIDFIDWDLSMVGNETYIAKVRKELELEKKRKESHGNFLSKIFGW